MRIINNILIAPATKQVTSGSKNENLFQDHNLYAVLDGSEPRFKGEKANNVVAPPKLELSGWNEGRREFKAAPDSPLRGAGMPLQEITGTDFFGKTRSADHPDIGPFVLGGS